jgi:DNA-directed RNA polymerase subunit RPC12/RpoP
MATAAAYKVRCPSCGKSFKVEGVDAGSQMVCRACGVRFQTAAPPLLGPLVGDDGLITLESSALADPIAMAGTSGVDREPRQPDAVTTPGEDLGESDALRGVVTASG